MGDATNISWTESTWNPITGCDEVSPGCDHCYAKTLAERFRGTPGHYFERGFDVVLRPDKLDQPLRWTRPRRIFVDSMSDVFHKDVSDDYVAQVFAIMALAPQHTFQLLTKRHGRMRSLLNSQTFLQLVWDRMRAMSFDRTTNMAPRLVLPTSLEWPLPNVWAGVSVEDQDRANLRIPALLDTPAVVRFISCEPLLGPVDLFASSRIDRDPGIDWVIAGGESGRGARPMHPQWARLLRDECKEAGIPFHFKQRGEYTWEHSTDDPWAWTPADTWVNSATGETANEELAMASGGSWTGAWRVGKKRAGRILDGHTHDDYPQAVTS